MPVKPHIQMLSISRRLGIISTCLAILGTLGCVGIVSERTSDHKIFLGNDTIRMTGLKCPESIRDIRNVLRTLEPGQSLIVEILRGGRKEHLEMMPYTVDADQEMDAVGKLATPQLLKIEGNCCE